jgi:hypothetical protein
VSRYDLLQQRAIRIFNELATLRKYAKRAPIAERPALEKRAKELSADLKFALDETTAQGASVSEILIYDNTELRGNFLRWCEANDSVLRSEFKRLSQQLAPECRHGYGVWCVRRFHAEQDRASA